MPDVAAGESLKVDDDPGNHSRIGPHRVLPAGFVCIRRNGLGGIPQLAVVQIRENIERAAIEDLESHQVEMDGMGILGQIDQAPDLDRVECRILSHRFMPVRAV